MSEDQKPTRDTPWFLKPEFIVAVATLLSAIFSGMRANNAANEARDAARDAKQAVTETGQTNRIMKMQLGLPPE